MNTLNNLTLEHCANCGEHITAETWMEGGAIHGCPMCPECFRFFEAAEFWRKEQVQESGC